MHEVSILVCIFCMEVTKIESSLNISSAAVEENDVKQSFFQKVFPTSSIEDSKAPTEFNVRIINYLVFLL